MLRFCGYFGLVTCLLLLLSGPSDAVAQAGLDNFRKGLEYEKAQQWEQAAGEFLEALKKDTAHTESIVHYKKAAANAARPLMEQARALLRKKDYAGAYQLLLKAYAYDDSIDWALSAVCGLQSGRVPDDGRDVLVHEEEEKRRRESICCLGCWTKCVRNIVWRGCPETLARIPEPLQNYYSYYANMEDTIRLLAAELGIKALFDAQTFCEPRFVNLQLKSVTRAQVMDYLLLQEGLFFVRLNEETIWVAAQKRRAQVQPSANDEPK